MSAHKAGDWVIYRKQKTSSSPGPRAQNSQPAPKGDTYTYVVEKYWIVANVLDDGRLQLCTRRGKQHIIEPDDPKLRKASWWQRWLLGSRFRAVESSVESAL